MNGAMPQVAVEFGRKTIPSKERPTIDTVESETTAGPAGTEDASRRLHDQCAAAPDPEAARKLSGVMLEHSACAAERLPGVAIALDPLHARVRRAP